MLQRDTTLHHGNAFTLPAPSAQEVTELLLCRGASQLERIVSTGQATPAGQWYDQPDDEFVVLLSGSAVLRFTEPEETLPLRPGDWLVIPAGRRHRVEQTAAEAATVWLAWHVPPQAAQTPPVAELATPTSARSDDTSPSKND